MLNDWAKMNRMVRITHEPTGVTAVASEYRSQHRNRDVSPALAESVIRSHIENKRAELSQYQEMARIELRAESD